MEFTGVGQLPSGKYKSKCVIPDYSISDLSYSSLEFNLITTAVFISLRKGNNCWIVTLKYFPFKKIKYYLSNYFLS